MSCVGICRHLYIIKTYIIHNKVKKCGKYKIRNSLNLNGGKQTVPSVVSGLLVPKVKSNVTIVFVNKLQFITMEL